MEGVFLLSLVFSGLVGFSASKKGRSGGGWFILSVLISPILSGICLLIAGEKKEISQ